MIYTEMTRKAMIICYDQHAGQKDKSGLPYIFHPFHVAEQMDDEESTIVALLHDVIEDTDMTIDKLREEGFNEDVLEALTYMTHDDKDDYLDYVRKIRGNPIATKVKLADLKHNMDESRLDHDPTDKDKARIEKYRKAKLILLHT